jgi:hypothetical protein
MAYGTVNADVIGTSTAGSNLGAGNASIMKNRIINGAMVIDQRNAGASVSTASGVVGYPVDRFKVDYSQTSKLTMQQNAGSVTPPVGFSNYLGITSSSAYSVLAGDYFVITQLIEGFNTADLNWGTANAKTVTLSFQVYSSLTGTFGGSLQNSAANRSYPFTYSIPVANTWTQISVTIAGDTTGTWVGATNGVGISVAFSIGMGSTRSGTANTWQAGNYVAPTGATSVVGTNGATFYITGVQLEVGTSATGYEYRLYNQELSACQRYYEKSYDIATVPATNTNNGRFQQTASSDGSGNMVLNIRFSVQKRSAPTMTAYAPSGTINLWTKSSASGIADVTLNWEFQTTGGTGAYLAVGNNSAVCAGNGHWTASAEL